MNGPVWAVLGGVLGAAVAVWLGKRRMAQTPAASPAAEGPPLLEWILRANGATGAWLIGPGTREVAVPKVGIPEELDRLVRARLEHQRMGDGQGVERLGSGTLVFASLDGRAAGLQLPLGSSTGVRATAQRDLARLLDYDRWRPVLAAVVRDQDSPGESVESVALRLAIQLERMLGVETCVALPRGAGVEIAGVSLRSDRRLLRALVEKGSALEQVTFGTAGPLTGIVLPFGVVRADRRKRSDPAFVCAIPGGKGPAGGIAAWTAEGAVPTLNLAAIRSAIEGAGPRLLGPHVLGSLPPGKAAFLTGQSYFPGLISGPFGHGLRIVFTVAAVLCVIAAVASWMRGGRYVHAEAEEAEVLSEAEESMSA
jgi:hypothetical protein